MSLAQFDRATLAKLSPRDLKVLIWRQKWLNTARDKQLPPDLRDHGNGIDPQWRQWGISSGRGFGKTLCGANWLGYEAITDTGPVENNQSFVIAPTLSDVRYTCFEGPTGLITTLPQEIIRDYNRSNLIITLDNGGIIRGFSAEEPERLRGPQASRCWCFTAGTAVATPSGPVAIEDIRAGDWVLTRQGARRVARTNSRDAEVGRVTFANGAKLIGTADHKVLTSRGWTRMDRLREGDVGCAIGASNGVVSAGTSTTASRATMSGRTRAFARNVQSDFIARCGSRLTALFQTATRFITETTTSHTTNWATSSFSEVRTTNGITSRTEEVSLRRTGASFPPLRWPAWTAERPFSASGPRPSPAARPAVSGASKRSVNFPKSARNAPQSLFLAPETSAVSVASTWRPMGRQSVYCLTVDSDPEFFANGVLVHNCDELAAWGGTGGGGARVAEETWDMMMFGLRLGRPSRVVWTTTPKPKEMIRKLTKPMAHRHITTGSSDENSANLDVNFFEQLDQYSGTQLERQERFGEIIDAEEGGIIQRSWIRVWPHDKPLPAFDWIIMSLDTAFTEKTIDKKTHNADPTACGLWGVFWHEETPGAAATTNVMMLDAWQEHLGLPELTARVKKESQVAYGDDVDRPMLKPLVGPARMASAGRKPDIILIEEKGSGISLRQNLERDGIFTYAYNPGREDKLTRLHVVSDVFARRQVWMPGSEHPSRKGKPKSWCEPVIAQLCSYRGPGSIRHDDHLDQTTQAIRLCKDKGLLTSIKKKLDDRDKERAMDEAPRSTRKSYVNPYGV